ncbi:hypothetical protein [Catellatospora sp. NPDC049609]|uniref:hypothetical protein n=1 Tax=Catellatospora sp. NPDC049609 TaxID=3155505 RepID=UPI00342B7519
MNFGVNLPGPFRIGFGGGRVNVGMNVGPISVSTNVGGGRRQAAGDGTHYAKGDLDEVVAVAVGEGWTVTGRDPGGVLMRQGRHRIHLQQVAPGVVAGRAVDGRGRALLITLAVMVPALLCAYAGDLI